MTWLILSTLLAAASAGSHPFSVHDMLAMDRISDPRVSPDGRSIAFVLRETDLEANRGRTDLWMVDAAGGEARRLTTHEAGDSNPRWSPDGARIYFLSSRTGSSQVWALPVAGGEAQQITDLPLDVGNLVLSRDGAMLAFTMEMFPDCETPACTKERLDEISARRHSARVYESLFVRHWDTWKDGRRSHLFTMPVGGGDPVDVTRGWDADVPSKPFGGPEEIAFTPGSAGIVFSARVAGREEAWSTNFDLWLAPVDGSTEPVALTNHNPAWDTQPAFSPDGATLAWLGMERAGFESDRFRIVLRPWPSEADGYGALVARLQHSNESVLFDHADPPRLTEGWDRSPRAFAWSPDGKAIYAIASDLGQRSLFRIDLPPIPWPEYLPRDREAKPERRDIRHVEPRAVIGEGTVRSIGFAGERIVYGLEHLRSPVELYSADRAGGDARRITRVNDAKVAAARMGEPEQFTFAGWNGETVHGYVVKPVDFDPERSYPVAFLIHGGPQGSFGNDFHYRWNPQAYAGAGYAAVMVDFHGSVGYGQEFQDSIRGDWGGKPLVDLRKGLAAALERYPWLDGDRVCALGASYGGYMVNWIAGNWPDRFRCLVNHDGNLDERMAYFDTEELWFPEWEHGGTPWDNPEGYARHNPIDHVTKWKTPMLVIHGALDYRVVDTQGLSTFTALQRKGIPSKLVYFPDENHWVLKPLNSVFWHETVIGWLDRWLR